jgi:UDP-N-acetyl-D-mannosaminuronate dehydrogenase
MMELPLKKDDTMSDESLPEDRIPNLVNGLGKIGIGLTAAAGLAYEAKVGYEVDDRYREHIADLAAQREQAIKETALKAQEGQNKKDGISATIQEAIGTTNTSEQPVPLPDAEKSGKVKVALPEKSLKK